MNYILAMLFLMTSLVQAESYQGFLQIKGNQKYLSQSRLIKDNVHGDILLLEPDTLDGLKGAFVVVEGGLVDCKGKLPCLKVKEINPTVYHPLANLRLIKND